MGFRYRGRCALITGASSGIGEAFADELAARGMHLLLVARTLDRLQTIAERLATRHAGRVETIRADLTATDAPSALQAAADARGLEPDLLVNNAGVGAFGDFAASPLERQLEMIQLNVDALVALTGLYLPRMLDRRAGAIINVGSAAAFQPLPRFAVYAASKAFVVSFSQALWAEGRGSGVRVVVVSPGPVDDTRFGEYANPGGGMFRGVRSVPRERVVRAALRALERNQPMATPGLMTNLIALAATLAPRRLQLLVTEALTRRSGSP